MSAASKARVRHARAVRGDELTATVALDRAALEARLRELDAAHEKVNVAFCGARTMRERKALANQAHDLFLRREIVSAVLNAER